ncbi:hypothetical protein, partial [Gilliamella sp. BG6]
WLNSHNLLDDYILQFRKWVEVKNTKSNRYIVIVPAGGGNASEAITRDYFRIVIISAINDSDVVAVNDKADEIRQFMLDDFESNNVISMSPISGITQANTEEGRFIFEFTAQMIISR